MSRYGEKVNRLKQTNPLTDTEAIYFQSKGPWKSVCFLDIASLCVIIFLLSESELSRDILRRSKYENYVSYHQELKKKRADIITQESTVVGFKTLSLALNLLEKRENGIGLSQLLVDQLREEMKEMSTER